MLDVVIANLNHSTRDGDMTSTEEWMMPILENVRADLQRWLPLLDSLRMARVSEPDAESGN